MTRLPTDLFGARVGPAPSEADARAKCDEGGAKLLALLTSTVATVRLQIEEPDPTLITPVRGALVLGANRRALLGKLTCPTGGSCAVIAPKKVAVTIAGTRFALTVTAPRLVRGGRTAGVSVTFTRAAAAALEGRSVSPSVLIRATNDDVTRSKRVLKRTVRGR